MLVMVSFSLVTPFGCVMGMVFSTTVCAQSRSMLGFGGPLLLSVFFLSLLSTIPMIDWIPTCSVQSGHHVGSGGVGWRRVLVHRIVASGPRGCGSACQQASGVDGQCRGLGLYGRAGLVDMKQRAYSLTNLLYRSSDVYHL